MKLRLFLLLLSVFSISMAMDKSGVNKKIALKINTPQVLKHITEFTPLLDDTVYGFHHYQPTSFTTEKGITTCIISDDLWIITADDHNEYHEGFIIYKGKLYGSKSFFPCKWNKDQLKNALENIKIEQIKAHLADIRVESKIEHEFNPEYEIVYNLENQLLKIGISYYPNSNQYFIKTILPKNSKSKKVHDLDLEQIATKQKNELVSLDVHQKISNVKNVDLSEIEKNISVKDVDSDYFYYTIFTATNDQTKVANEVLSQAIAYYKSDIFDIALPYAQLNQNVLSKLISKPRDDKLACERAKMIKFVLLQNPDLEITDTILELALKADSSHILNPLIQNYVYWNKLNKISAKVRSNKKALEIIERYEKEAKEQKINNDPLLHATYYANNAHTTTLCRTATDGQLINALDLVTNREIENILKKEINKREQLKEEEKKKKKEETKTRELENLKKFSELFKAKLEDANRTVEFTKEEIEIVRPYKDKILTDKGTTPILMCISKGKLVLIGQLLKLGVNQFCPTYDDNKNIATLDILDFALKKEYENPDNEDYKKTLTLLMNTFEVNVIGIISKWIEVENGFKKTITFIEKYQKFLWNWFDLVIKNKKFTLENFTTLLEKFNDKLLKEVDEDNKNILIIAAQAERKDIVEHLISLKVPYRYKHKEQKISVFDFINQNNATFEYLNNLEIERKKLAEQKKAELEKAKKEQDQKAAAELAQQKNWTPLMRAIQKNVSEKDIVKLIDDQHTDIFAIDADGLDAEKHAIDKNLKHIAKKIQSKKVKSELIIALNHFDNLRCVSAQKYFEGILTPDKIWHLSKKEIAIAQYKLAKIYHKPIYKKEKTKEVTILLECVIEADCLDMADQDDAADILATIYSNQGKKQESIRLNLTIIQSKSYSDDCKKRAMLDLGILFRKEEIFVDAYKYLKMWLDNPLEDAPNNLLATVYFEFAYVCNNLDKEKSTLKYFNKFLKLSEGAIKDKTIDQSHLQSAYAALVSIYMKKGELLNLDEAFESCIKYLSLKQSQDLTWRHDLNPEYVISNALLSILSSVKMVGNEKVYSYCNELSKHMDILPADVKNKLQEASELSTRLIAISAETDKTHAIQLRFELAERYLALKMYQDAIATFKDVLDRVNFKLTTDTDDVNLIKTRIYTLDYLGIIYIPLGQHNESFKYFAELLDNKSYESISSENSTKLLKLLKSQPLTKLLENIITTSNDNNIDLIDYLHIMISKRNYDFTNLIKLVISKFDEKIENTQDEYEIATLHFNKIRAYQHLKYYEFRDSAISDILNMKHSSSQYIPKLQREVAIIDKCVKQKELTLQSLEFIEENDTGKYFLCKISKQIIEMDIEEKISEMFHNLTAGSMHNLIAICEHILQTQIYGEQLKEFVKETLRKLSPRNKLLNDESSSSSSSTISNQFELVETPELTFEEAEQEIIELRKKSTQYKEDNNFQKYVECFEEILKINPEDHRLKQAHFNTKISLADAYSKSNHSRSFDLSCEVLKDELANPQIKELIHHCIVRIFESLIPHLLQSDEETWATAIKYSDIILTNDSFCEKTQKFILEFLETTLEKNKIIPNNIKANLHYLLGTYYIGLAKKFNNFSKDLQKKTINHYNSFIKIECTNPKLIDAQEGAKSILNGINKLVKALKQESKE